MTHPVRFKFLLLLTFAVWIHQCEAFASKSTVLNDCCSFGRNRSKNSCDGSSYNLNLVPKSLQIECKSKIKYCCRRQRETDDCNEGILAAQNGSLCPSLSNKYTICYKACSLGIKMAEKGENCSGAVTGEESFEINARKTCCEQKTKEVLLPEDEETDEATNEDDDYGDDEHDTFFDTSSPSSEEETTTTARSTTQSETTHHTTITEATTETTTTSKSIDYDEATTKFPTTTRYSATTTTISPEETTIKVESLTAVYSDSLETNEVDTTTTIRRSPPIFRHPTTTNKLFLSASDTISTTRPSSDNMRTYAYERPQYSEIKSSNPQTIYNYYPKYPKPHYYISNIFHDPTKFRASSRNSGNNAEPCGNIRYCDHNCIVTNGIQKCSCNKGYKLQRDGKTCLKTDGSRLPPEEIRFKKRCQHGHFLNDLGECQDIDECKIQNNGCGDKAYCRNKIGSYECIPMDICRTGYRYNEISKTCEDINECVENLNICNNGQCNNTVGSYTCEDSYSEFKARCEESVFTTLPTTRAATTRRTTTTQRPCPQGFERNNRGICVDIDECQFNPCDQGLICVNRNGGYTCDVSHCNPGFKPEGRACTDINECDNNPCPVTHNCMNTHGSYVCKMKFCPRGYRLDRFGGCEDINECHIYKNLCRNADCINTDGSYTCNCNPGFRMDEKNYCRDINECAENIHDCSHQCRNTFGGYQCYCENGYRLNANKKTCDDIDECSENRDLLCQGECENTLGGYECKCPAGFRKEESYCTDIDECEENPGYCDKRISRCLNTPGSYRCMDIRCKEDYKLVRRNGEKYCHLRTPCGDDDYDDNCNKPWMYSYSFTSRVANCSASNIFHLGINTQLRYDVVIENVQADSTKDNVIIAGTDDFLIHSVSSGFFLATTKPIDGPQEINVDVLVTFYRPDGSVEHKRGVKVQMIVSEFSFYKFSVRK